MKTLEKAVKYFLTILLLGMTILTMYQIIMRFVFNNPSSWSEEAVRILFIWASFIAGGIGIKDRIHIGIDVLVNLFPAKLRKAIAVISNCAIVFFSAWLFGGAWKLMVKSISQPTPALGVPRSLLYAPIVLFCVLVFAFGIREVILCIRSINDDGKGAAE